jgi:ATP-dependent Clp protease, protease subunit
MNLGKEFEKYAIKHRGINSNTLNDYNKYQVNNLTANVIEERPMNIAVMDVYSRLMMDRIIFLGYPLTDEVANIITAQLLFLESTDRSRDIQMYINCPGGSVFSGMGVYDTMQYIGSDVSTICIGMAASMGAVLLLAGQKGKRTALKHSRVMLHQPSGGIGGQATDIQIAANLIKTLKAELYTVIGAHTGKDVETIAKDCDRDYWMTGAEAKAYGIVDEVLERNPNKEL